MRWFWHRYYDFMKSVCQSPRVWYFVILFHTNEYCNTWDEVILFPDIFSKTTGHINFICGTRYRPSKRERPVDSKVVISDLILWNINVHHTCGVCSKKGCIYLRYHDKTNTIVFTYSLQWAKSISESPLLTDLACMAMTFISQLTYVVGSVRQLKNK